MPKNKLKEIFFVSFVLIFLGFLFSHRLTKVPPGINMDESSIGYNATLISHSLKDENNRFLPVFVLTLGGKDWKQPVRIYSTALFFKLFGSSYLNLKFVSVFFALVSSFVFYLILRLFFPLSISMAGLFFFASAPSLFIQSHLALENIDLLPFMLLWLYFLLSFSIKPRNFKLILSAVFLGISFYAYKGMRTTVPVYLGLSLAYLFYLAKTKKETNYKSLIYFTLGIAPLLLPLKWLQTHYAGAIYDPTTVGLPSFFQAALVYLSSFDFSFLFLKGDKILVHSTGRDGMFLIPNIILFFIGFSKLVKEKKHQFYFIFICLIFTPLLLVTVNSIYRASRLMAFIPLFTFIFTFGFKQLLEIKNKYIKHVLPTVFIVLLVINFIGFLKNYWTEYPKLISQDFSPNFDQSFYELSNLAKINKVETYVEYNDYMGQKSDIDFFWEVYFPDKKLETWQREKEKFPENALVLTSVEGSKEIINFKTIPSLEAGQKTIYLVGKSK